MQYWDGNVGALVRSGSAPYVPLVQPRDDHRRRDHVPDQRHQRMLVGLDGDADPLEQIRSTPGVAARYMTPSSTRFVQGTGL